MFEILEHTADIGFLARGGTIEELFQSAAEALASIALEQEGIEARRIYALEAFGEDRESLLVNWLSEALWLIDGRRLALTAFRVLELTESRVAGEALGEPFDPARHRAKVVVKGVTWHQLEVAQDAEGWRARVFLDI